MVERGGGRRRGNGDNGRGREIGADEGTGCVIYKGTTKPCQIRGAKAKPSSIKRRISICQTVRSRTSHRVTVANKPTAQRITPRATGSHKRSLSVDQIAYRSPQWPFGGGVIRGFHKVVWRLGSSAQSASVSRNWGRQAAEAGPNTRNVVRACPWRRLIGTEHRSSNSRPVANLPQKRRREKEKTTESSSLDALLGHGVSTPEERAFSKNTIISTSAVCLHVRVRSGNLPSVLAHL